MKVFAESRSKVCAVKAVQKFLSLRPVGDGPLFCHANRAPVTRYQFAALLYKCSVKAGFDADRIKTHSFRIGRATDLSAMAVPVAAIKQMGRWESEAYKLYIR